MKYRIYAAGLILSLIFSGCGSSAPAVQKSTFDAGRSELAEEDTAGAVLDGTGEDNMMVTPEKADPEKIVYNGNLTLRTHDLQGLSEKIRELVSALGGYVEAESTDHYPDDGQTLASFQTRIPAEQFDEFTEKLSALADVVSAAKNASNIGKNYRDAESHVQSLEAEKSRLEDLMKQAESVADIAAIEDQLRQVNDELDSWKQAISDMDQDIQYSTVWVTAEEISETGQIGQAFEKTWESFLGGLSFFCILFAYALPWLITVAVIILLIWLIRRHRNRRPQIPR